MYTNPYARIGRVTSMHGELGKWNRWLVAREGLRSHEYIEHESSLGECSIEYRLGSLHSRGAVIIQGFANAGHDRIKDPYGATDIQIATDTTLLRELLVYIQVD